jgi:16S rRNA (cytidine1402-2'-O)-methyltransferase
LPTKSGRRRQALADIADQDGTLVLFEAPRRLPALLADITGQLGDREVTIARELTKKFETVITAQASALAQGLDDDMLRGECVVLIAPRAAPAPPNADALDALLVPALEAFSLRDAVSEVTRASGVSRRTVYDRALMLNKNKKPPHEKPEKQANT